MSLATIVNLLKSATTQEEIDASLDEILEIFPILRICIDFDQQNYAHQYDLWHHMVQTTLNLPRNLDDDMLYLGALLHDIGKPSVQHTGKRPNDIYMHYAGHQQASADLLISNVFPMLEKQGINLCQEDMKLLHFYVLHHDDHISANGSLHLIQGLLQEVSLETFQKLMQLEVADAKAHNLLPIIQERIDDCSILATELIFKVYPELKDTELYLK